MHCRQDQENAFDSEGQTIYKIIIKCTRSTCSSVTDNYSNRLIVIIITIAIITEKLVYCIVYAEGGGQGVDIGQQFYDYILIY